MRNFMKRVATGAASTAAKASPIPIPDSVLEKVGIQTDKLVDVMDRLQRLEDQIGEIVDFIRDVQDYFDDEEEDV